MGLPAHLSVSQLVTLRRSPAELARLDPPPGAAAAAAARPSRHGLPRMAGAAVRGRPAPRRRRAAGLRRLRRGVGRRLSSCSRASSCASEWAARQPVEVEVPFETLIEGVLVRGRMDAVFRARRRRLGRRRLEDRTAARGSDADASAVQLAAYRLAWHRLTGCADRGESGPAFHYVRTGETVRPADLLDADGLAALVRGVPLSGDGMESRGLSLVRLCPSGLGARTGYALLSAGVPVVDRLGFRHGRRHLHGRALDHDRRTRRSASTSRSPTSTTGRNGRPGRTSTPS